MVSFIRVSSNITRYTFKEHTVKLYFFLPNILTKLLKKWEHCRNSHGGQLGHDGGIADFKFKVSGSFKKCMDRQIDEGLRISACEMDGEK